VTFRINVSLEPDGTRRVDVECEPASDAEIGLAMSGFHQVLRQLHHPTLDSPEVPPLP
jgi:hypothetical protein